MGLNIKNREVERLAAEVARIAGESKTEAIRRALVDRKQRLALRPTSAGREERVRRLLRNRIWPQIAARLRGRAISKKEREAILGYGPGGV